jgi:eukaryotic-like serine/threonine-protein kinase
MTDRSTGDAAVTGVAKGSLGTGTALDETQEWVIPAELRSAAAEPEAAIEPEPEPAPVAAVAAPAVRSRKPAPGTPPAARGRALAPRTAGIAAVALLALLGGAAVVTSLANRDVPAAGAPAQVQPTTAPTDAPLAEPGGKGKDKDDGKGNGHGNGKGNGND